MTRELEPDNAGARNSLTGFPKSSREEKTEGRFRLRRLRAGRTN